MSRCGSWVASILENASHHSYFGWDADRQPGRRVTAESPVARPGIPGRNKEEVTAQGAPGKIGKSRARRKCTAIAAGAGTVSCLRRSQLRNEDDDDEAGARTQGGGIVIGESTEQMGFKLVSDMFQSTFQTGSSLVPHGLNVAPTTLELIQQITNQFEAVW